MSNCRRILLTGLPAGVGVSSIALALSDALIELKRSLCFFAPMKDLALERAPGLGAVQSQWGTCFRATDDLHRIPLETLDSRNPIQAMQAMREDASLAVIDRFTGLNVRNSPWFAIADEVLVIVDGRPEHSHQSLAFIDRILQEWPRISLRILINRLPSWKSPAVASLDLRNLLQKRLAYSLDGIGVLHESTSMRRSSGEGQALTRIFPNAPEARCIRQMARRLLSQERQGQRSGHHQKEATLFPSSTMRLS